MNPGCAVDCSFDQSSESLQWNHGSWMSKMSVPRSIAICKAFSVGGDDLLALMEIILRDLFIIVG